MVYNVGGSLNKITDQLGTVVDYTYTNSRNPELEKVTTLGTGVDGHVRSIKREYDDLGRMDTITNYANSDGTGTIRSQILLEFNDIGNVSKSWQSHEGAKGAGTPNVQYTFDLSADGNSVYDDGARLWRTKHASENKQLIHYLAPEAIALIMQKQELMQQCQIIIQKKTPASYALDFATDTFVFNIRLDGKCA